MEKIKHHEREKIKLELLFTGDGRIFMNFWDWRRGSDVCAQVIAGELVLDDKIITLQDFINKVDERS